MLSDTSTNHPEMACSRPFSLRNGLELPNRLFKASISEDIPCRHVLSDARLINVYHHWAQGVEKKLASGAIRPDMAPGLIPAVVSKLAFGMPWRPTRTRAF